MGSILALLATNHDLLYLIYRAFLDAGICIVSTLLLPNSERLFQSFNLFFYISLTQLGFKKIVEERRDRGIGKNGKPLTPRKIFLMASTEVFDHYGRLLAYVNAAYEKKERDRFQRQSGQHSISRCYRMDMPLA